MSSRYDDLSREQLVSLLVRRDAERKLGLVWERNEIERDRALNSDFISLSLDPELSCGEGPFQNLIIEGDNFDALRWLRMTMKGRIKCIYIDPPYNTGNKDWVYNDHYVAKEDRYRHSVWLEFLHQRLSLARDLLAPDGVLMVSINDENRAKLELMLDEVLPGMRVGSFVWKTRNGTFAEGGRMFSPDHEHVLIYGAPEFAFTGFEKSFEKYTNPDGDPLGDWRLGPITQPKTIHERPNAYYALRDPETDLWFPCNPARVWAYATEARVKPGAKLRAPTIEELVAGKRVAFPRSREYVIFHTLEDLLSASKDPTAKFPRDARGAPLLYPGLPEFDRWVGRKIGLGAPQLKIYRSKLGSERQPVSSWITANSEVQKNQKAPGLYAGYNQEGTKIVTGLLGAGAFPYPKPVSLISGLISQCTGRDDIVLDFFAGSGTTGQAVLEINAADGEARKFILVSSSEATEDDPDKNVCRDVCAERIRRVAAGTGDREPLFGDFAYLKVEKIDFHDLSYDLKPADIWAAVQACHDLPLAPYLSANPLQVSSDGELAIAYCDKPTPDVLARLEQLAGEGFLIVYSWSPGRIEPALAGRNTAEVRAVPDELIRRFQS